MRESNSEKKVGPKSTKRSFLKKAGVAAVGLPFASNVVLADTKDEKDPYMKSLELREENNWSASRWHDYLEEEEKLSSGSSQVTVSNPVPETPSETPSGTPSGPSPDKLDRVESTFTFTYTRHNESVTPFDDIDLEWNHKAGDLDDYGENPPDLAGISFASNHYDRTYEEDWVYYERGNLTKDPNGFNSKDPNHGAAAIFKDGGIASGYNSWFGLRVEPNEDLSPSDREIEFDYAHTYPVGKIEGISIGTGGISFSVASKTKRWDYEESFREKDIVDGKTTDPGPA
ncbi:hypothetical protein [Halosimplex sp. TS25]|uniref:hypothetical protein n=1 Tax=Halosimplex rarum TaxID=3396619 RepID=UPI0039EB6764